jgi:hypothetical protein
MDEPRGPTDADAERFRSARTVFDATWRDSVGRRWPNLAGDVEALCHLAFELGRAPRGRGRGAGAEDAPGARRSPTEKP